MAEVKIQSLPTLEVEGTELRVLKYTLSEGLSALSELTLEAEQDGEQVPPGDLIGKRAGFHLTRTDGSGERHYFGDVIFAERFLTDDGASILRLQVAPHPWRASKRTNCRTFQEKSVVDVVTEVLEGAGVSSDQQRWQVTGDYPARTYTVQYRESDFAFVRRILSEEGIYFAVHHVDGLDVLFFGDEPTGLGEVSGNTTLAFRHDMGFSEDIDYVTRVTQTQRVAPDKVMLRDYNPENPSLEVEFEVESDDDGSHVLEVYDYPARCKEPAEAEKLAKILLDELQASRHLVHGETGALSLWPGLRFSIENHPYGVINQEYMVVSVEIEGTTPRLGARDEAMTSRNRFVAMPTEHRYRPPRTTRAAEMVGLQTTFTTGPSGTEVHTSEAGEVTIRYHWDRTDPSDDSSSPFVRTSQLATGGSVLIPRVGWEVSTVHLDGDPDRPLVMGRMYNTVTPPPYNLPDEAGRSSVQTATTPGGGSTNELRMTDTAGAEEMFFNASKDTSVTAKNNATTSVANNSSRSVGANQEKNITNSLTATTGANQEVSVGGNQTVSVETQLQDEVGADHSLDIGGNRDMKVGGDHKRDVGADSTVDIGGRMLDLVVGSITDETLEDYKHEVSSALVDIVATDRSLQVAGKISETAGAAKVIAVNGGRGLEVTGNLTQKVAGAIINLADGDRSEASGGMYSEIAAGAHVVKADNITIEAETMLSVVMGASTVILLPAVVSVLGLKLKIDGDVVDDSVLVVDN